MHFFDWELSEELSEPLLIFLHQLDTLFPGLFLILIGVLVGIQGVLLLFLVLDLFLLTRVPLLHKMVHFAIEIVISIFEVILMSNRIGLQLHEHSLDLLIEVELFFGGVTLFPD
jgi:quinol-cytochrome oxidoreductase complex cytochrome b subunit